jgi:uncharacterized protein YigE (DUF2233 family)
MYHIGLKKMIILNKKDCLIVSGATYGVCTIDEYMPSFVEVDYNYQSPMLIFSEAINAAFWGCSGALMTGKGLPGCFIGGSIAAAGKTMSYFIQDAYWMYQAASAN